jgi:hypothetical protein
MATRGASKSVSNVSKNDSEIEARLQALESKAHTPCNGGSADTERIAALEEKVDALIKILNKVSAVTGHCPKNKEGIREISL